MDSFDTWVTFCIGPGPNPGGEEGPFSDDPGDPGGATLFGVTIKEFRDYIGNPYLSVDDFLQQCTREKAIEIMRVDYWDRMGCNSLPAGCNLMVADHGWNAGQGTSLKLLQSVLGVQADGIVGPITRLALRGADISTLLAGLNRRQGAYYRSLSTFDTFGRGWLARLGRRYALARQLAGLA